MAIINIEESIKYLCKWLKEYTRKNNKSAFVIELRNLNSIAAALICHKIKLPTYIITDECSDKNNELIELFLNLPQSKNIKLFKVNTTKINECIKENLNKINIFDEYSFKYTSPLITHVARNKKALIINPINRNKYKFARYYIKHLDNIGDLLLFADLFQNEIIELYNYLTNQSITEQKIESIYDITEDELEWLDRKNSRTKIIEDNKDPTKHREWCAFTGRQKIITSRLYQIEKLSQHKKIMDIPICEIRKENWFIT